MQEQPADPRDREMMAALGLLKLPPPGASQRDIWYRAGVEAGRRHANTWKALAAVVALSASIALAWDRRPVPAPHAVYVQHVPPASHSTTTPAASATTATASLAYERMRERLIEQGLNGLPPIDFSGDGGQSFAPPHGDSREPEDAQRLLWYR